MSSLELILGPVVIGVVLNVLLYGVCLLQFITYYTSGYQDRKPLKLLVGWVLVLDTYHTCSSVYMLWYYVITNFNNPAVLAAAPWPFTSSSVSTVLASCPIELFLAWRIKLFSDSWWIFGALSTLALVQAALGIVAAVRALELTNLASFYVLIPLVDAWLSLTVICDLAITVLLLLYLWRSRTGSRVTDNIITRIIRSSVETAAFGAIFVIMDLVMFTIFQETNIYVVFALPLGRIYTNTLLTTLNSRASLRNNLQDSVSFTSGPFVRFAHAERSNDPMRSTQRNIPGSLIVPTVTHNGRSFSEIKESSVDRDVESTAGNDDTPNQSLGSHLGVGLGH